MSAGTHGCLPYDASLDAYDREAAWLLAALGAHDAAAEWRAKWEHHCFRERDVADVRRASLTIDDPRTVVAREQGFDGWPQLAAFVAADLSPRHSQPAHQCRAATMR